VQFLFQCVYKKRETGQMKKITDHEVDGIRHRGRLKKSEERL